MIKKFDKGEIKASLSKEAIKVQSEFTQNTGVEVVRPGEYSKIMEPVIQDAKINTINIMCNSKIVGQVIIIETERKSEKWGEKNLTREIGFQLRWEDPIKKGHLVHKDLLEMIKSRLSAKTWDFSSIQTIDRGDGILRVIKWT